MSTYDEDVARICMITGVTIQQAVDALELADGDVGTAIQMHFDGTFNESHRTHRESPDPSYDSQSSEHSQEIYEFSDDITESTRYFDEKMMFNVNPSFLFTGNLRQVMNAAKEANKWVIVNIQSLTHFPCHALNRDVWNYSLVQNLINDYFVLFQTYGDMRTGKYLNSLYNTKTHYPFVGVIDPRTRELVREINQFTCDDVLCILYDFVDRSPAPVHSRTPTRLFEVLSEEDDVCDASYKLSLPGDEKIISVDYSRSVRHLLRKISELGYNIDDYKVITTFPVIDITKVDYNMSLKEAGLHRRQRLIIAKNDQ